jgi:hypothetical protein
MISIELYDEITAKYGAYSSWAVWADAGDTPKSNIGDISIFELRSNPNLLSLLNPDVIMIGLNFSRNVCNGNFANFHDGRTQSQDFKIRYAFKNSKFYGAYMTDIIKNFEQKKSDQVVSYLKLNREFELQNVRLFEQEVADIGSINPLIIAFGNNSYNILYKHFGNKYRLVKIPHYSNYVSKEDYRKIVKNILYHF